MEQHVCNVASCAPGPLRQPSLVLSVRGCCKSESVSTACIALFQSPVICGPPSPFFCGAMCSALALLVTIMLQQCLPPMRTHTHARTQFCGKNSSLEKGGGLNAVMCKESKRTWHIVSYQSGDMFNMVMKSRGTHLLQAWLSGVCG